MTTETFYITQFDDNYNEEESYTFSAQTKNDDSSDESLGFVDEYVVISDDEDDTSNLPAIAKENDISQEKFLQNMGLVPYNHWSNHEPNHASSSSNHSHTSFQHPAHGSNQHFAPDNQKVKFTKKDLSEVDFTSPGGVVLGKMKNIHVTEDYQMKKLALQEKFCESRKKATAKNISKKRKRIES